MEAKSLHLQMLQAVISRMADNSMKLREWVISIVSALLAFSFSQEKNGAVIPISAAAAVCFLILDIYYLCLERAFRQLFDKVRLKTEQDIDFSMRPELGSIYERQWWGALFSAMGSPVILVFYSCIFLAICAAWFLHNGLSTN